MAYVYPNFRTKKRLKDAVALMRQVQVFDPGPFDREYQDGVFFVEGPHFPEPHRWYAQVTVKDGKVVKVK